jgi:6-phosphogluconolactonase
VVSHAAQNQGSLAVLLVYFGTYTGPSSAGIYVSRFDPEAGQLSTPELAAATANPSFVAVDPDERHLFAVNEVSEFGGEHAGAVSAFVIDRATGRLRFLNQVSTGGATPCHLSTDRKGRWLFVSNYGGGSVAVLPILSDGLLGHVSSLVRHEGRGPNPVRQESPHVHAAALDPSGILWVADLGIDRVLGYRFDEVRGELDVRPAFVATLAAGSGPRHLQFTHGRNHLYVVEELSLAVTALRVDAGSGAVVPFQTISTVEPGISASPDRKAAGIQLHPSGRFLFTSTRGTNSLAVFSRGRAER